MPDWTYHPLSPIASSLLGERRTRILALRMLAVLVTKAGGRRWIPAVFDHTPPPPQLQGRLGATVPPSIAREAVAVLPVQGASLVEIGPVGPGDVAALRLATADRSCRVIAYATDQTVAEAISGFVDEVTVGPGANLVRLSDPDVDHAVDVLTDSRSTVLVTPAVLIDAGPGWFNRVYEAGTPTTPPQQFADVGMNPRRWPAWFWGLLVGVGMVVAGLGAAAIALGPVLLWYDRDYLGASVNDLHSVNHHLVGFLIHDRLTMAGNMIGIGVLYIGLAVGGIRRGYGWARTALLISGLFSFLTLFYFLVTGFVEPLHTLVVIVLFPMFVLAVWRRPATPHWSHIPSGPEAERRRALWGQLLMIGVGGGLFVAGAVISTVGLTTVFVPTDVSFLGGSAATPRLYAEPNLLTFIAHDRAGFGGALMGSGLAVLLISMWGWRRGRRWVWWALLSGCAAGTLPVLVIHFSIGYTHFEHLLPVYVLVVVVVTALWLSRPYLGARVAAADLVREG